MKKGKWKKIVGAGEKIRGKAAKKKTRLTREPPSSIGLKNRM